MSGSTRVTQARVETLGSGTDSVRVTQLRTEALAGGGGDSLRVTQFIIQVLCTDSSSPRRTMLVISAD